MVGLIERGPDGRVLLFPVDNRREETLLAIIRRYVEPGSTIMTDSFASYRNLHRHGFKHFAVNHKNGFRHVYRHRETGEEVHAHTNTIEGFWSHAKVRRGFVNDLLPEVAVFVRVCNLYGHLYYTSRNTSVTSMAPQHLNLTAT